MIGRTISRYRLEEKLGEGGMGVVYRAQDLRLNRTVAIKMLRPELAADVSLRRRLDTEARATSALSHAGIATLFDFETEGDVFLVYEYIRGKTLRALQAERPLDLPKLTALFIAIAEGLAAAHESGVIHRDIKPENVMVREDGHVKILDFGLAKLGPAASAGARTQGTALTLPGLLLGTIAYMSPEQLEGEEVDHRTDIFSLGTLFYELASGQHPFQGKSPSSTIGNILKEEPRRTESSVHGGPPELERIILKCVRKNPEERYQSVREILVDLRAFNRSLLGVPGSESIAASDESSFALPLRSTVCRLAFLMIQAGYLALYAAAIYWGDEIRFSEILGAADDLGLEITLILAMCGVAVRLYLISAIGWNHPQAGRRFVRLFPALLLFDGVWASSPLLVRRLGWLSLFFVAAMAYLPFAQRTLVLSIYPNAQDSRVMRLPSRS